LFATKVVVRNCDGFFTKKAKTLAENCPFLLLNSILNLLDERYAISIPEKKAENNSVTKIHKKICAGIFAIICFKVS
jgi:hypothetical protein